MTEATTHAASADRRALPRADAASPATQARVRARYRAERRFRLYGQIALAVTSLFVAALIGDVALRAWPAFWQHHLVLDVPIAADAFGDKRDEAAIRGADYFPITRDALKAAIPGIESRSEEKALTRLLSSGAGDVVRNRLLAEPGLIGRSVRLPLVLSAGADLHFKRPETAITSRPARGMATPSGTTGEVTIKSSADDFADDVALVGKMLSQEAQRLSLEAESLHRTGGAAALEKIEGLRAQAAALRARAAAPKLDFPLDDKWPSLLIAINGGLVKVRRLGSDAVTGDALLPLTSTLEAATADWRILTYVTPRSDRKISDLEVAFLERFRAAGQVERRFNWLFFTAGDSREPELAGIRGALAGSALTLLVTLALCLPIGVMAAIYLEEFAPRNRFTDLIEVNINNLAAVPSIVFGLLGLAVFLNFFGLPRSAPLVGGLVLALLVLPTIIIASRAALKAVPPSVKEAALGVGASEQQAIFHHVLPLAMPGIMTGTIIGMAHALGETAPLLMVGMVAFIVDIPAAFSDAATVLPVQVYLWADLPEAAFKEKTAAAIVVLLVFLFLVNGLAIWLRKRFERRW